MRHSCDSPAPLSQAPLNFFFVFPKLKYVLKGHHFGTLENIQNSVTDMLKTIPVEDFQRCYRLHRCESAQRNYFEGDNIDVWKKKPLVNKKSASLLFCHTSYVIKTEYTHVYSLFF